MALNRSVITAWVDDDGSNTVGELISKSDFLVGLCDPIDAEIARLDAAAGGKAPLASPALTGTPTAPTAAALTNTTQLATTAFVTAADAAAIATEVTNRNAADAAVIATEVANRNTAIAVEGALHPALPGTSAPTTTGTQNALAIPAGTGDLVLYLNNATLLTVQGILAGIAGQFLTIVSKGAGQVDFAHLHASGTALGKLRLVATTGLTSLAPGSGVAVFQYDATVTQWRLVSHEQGAWITTPYAVATYTAASGLWTVDAPDVETNKYKLDGRTVLWRLKITGTSVSSTPVSLNVALPSGFLAAVAGFENFMRSDAGGATGYGIAVLSTGSAIMNLYLAISFAGAWSVAVNNTAVYLSFAIEVQ